MDYKPTTEVFFEQFEPDWVDDMDGYLACVRDERPADVDHDREVES